MKQTLKYNILFDMVNFQRETGFRFYLLS